MLVITNESLIENGAKSWVSKDGKLTRWYFNTSEVLAKCVGFTITEKATYAEELRAGKTKSYFCDGVFHADSGEIKVALSTAGYKVVRV